MTARQSGVLLAATMCACGAEPEPAICTVVDHGDGTATIVCPDGSSATVGSPSGGADATTDPPEQTPVADTPAQEPSQGESTPEEPDPTAISSTDPEGTPISEATPEEGGTEPPACVVVPDGEGGLVAHCPDGTTYELDVEGDEQDATGMAATPHHEEYTPPGEHTPALPPTPDPSCEGQFYLVQPAQLSELAGCEALEGGIFVDGSQITELDPLYALRSVTGGVTVTATNLQDIDGLEQLLSVGGTLNLRNTPHLERLHLGLSRLEEVGGMLLFGGLMSLSSIEMPGLETVGADVVIGDGTTSSLVLDAPGLRSMGKFTLSGTLYLEELTLSTSDRLVGSILLDGDAPLLESFTLERTQALEGELTFQGQTSLNTVALTALAEILGPLRLDSIAGGAFTAPDLQSVAGLAVARTSQLAALRLPELQTIFGSLDLNANELLQQIYLPALDRLDGDLIITNNPRLSTCAAQEFADSLVSRGLISTDQVHIEGNAPCSE